MKSTVNKWVLAGIGGSHPRHYKFYKFSILPYLKYSQKCISNMQGNKIMYFIGVGGSCVLAMFAAFMMLN